jgi:hypothetical protein
MIPMTRQVRGAGRHTYAYGMYHSGAGTHRPLPGGAPVVTGPLPVSIPGAQPFAGMDPSNPMTYVRPWNPAPGMVGRLNFDGSQVQARTPTGGLQRGRHQRRAGYR